MILFWIDDNYASIQGLAQAFRGPRIVAGVTHVWVHVSDNKSESKDAPDGWLYLNIIATLPANEILAKITEFANDDQFAVALDLMLESTDSETIGKVSNESTALLSMKICKELMDSGINTALYSKVVRGDDSIRIWETGFNATYAGVNTPDSFDYNDISASGAPNKAIRDHFKATLGLN